jgi:hypothetical protein
VITLDSHSAPAAAVAPASPAAAKSPVKIVVPAKKAARPAPAPTRTIIVQPVQQAPAAPSYSNSLAVVTQFYQDITNHNYTAAWNEGGKNIGGTDYNSWVAGYDTTASISLNTTSDWNSGNVQASLVATQTDGSTKYYSGTYTVSGGAIVSASITQDGGTPGYNYQQPSASGYYNLVPGPNTSEAFAEAVAQAYIDGGYWNQTGTSQFSVYSPTTGQSYLMTSSSVGNPVVVTGGNGASVSFDVS